MLSYNGQANLLQVENLRGGYDKKEVLHGVSFQVGSGDVLCLLGPNGCGKSTLLKLLLSFLPKMSGRIRFNGADLESLSRKKLARIFSYIPQTDQMSFPYTALEMVIMARASHLYAFESPKKSDLEMAEASLEELKIAHLKDTLYTTLSGGQRQLVLIARALCQNTSVLVMDEPTASLDFANQKLIMNAVCKLADRGKLVITTTHSPSQPFAIANKVLLLRNGNAIGFGAPQEVLTNRSLENVYGLPMEVVSVTDSLKREHQICLSI